MKPIKKPLDVEDPFFMEFFHSIPQAKRIQQSTLLDYIPKKFGEKRTYPQDWPAYDAAKTNEYFLFKELLRELLFLAEVDVDKLGAGRKGYSVSG